VGNDFGFGGWANYRNLLSQLEATTDVGQALLRLAVKDAYIENLRADNIDLTSLDQDDIQDGSTYARVKSTCVNASGIVISDQLDVSGSYGVVLK